MGNCTTCDFSEAVESDGMYWFLGSKPHTETREKVYIMTTVSRNPRQIVGHAVNMDKSADTAPGAKRYCTDGIVVIWMWCFQGGISTAFTTRKTLTQGKG